MCTICSSSFGNFGSSRLSRAAGPMSAMPSLGGLPGGLPGGPAAGAPIPAEAAGKLKPLRYRRLPVRAALPFWERMDIPHYVITAHQGAFARWES